MNQKRRKQINEASAGLSDDLMDMLRNIAADLEDINMDEETARENMPESLQETDRYYESEEASEHLMEAVEHVLTAAAEIECAQDELERVILGI